MQGSPLRKEAPAKHACATACRAFSVYGSYESMKRMLEEPKGLLYDRGNNGTTFQSNTSCSYATPMPRSSSPCHYQRLRSQQIRIFANEFVPSGNSIQFSASVLSLDAVLSNGLTLSGGFVNVVFVVVLRFRADLLTCLCSARRCQTTATAVLTNPPENARRFWMLY